MKTCHRLLLILLLALTDLSYAKPFIPEQDSQVIERLPEQLFQSKTNSKIKLLRAQLKTHPDDWPAASQLAQHYIELAKTRADPRYMGYAQSILKPWWQTPQPPLPALVMRAIIRQNGHDFTGANADLDQILHTQPGHIQANLIKATIATVQGNYQTAIHHCRQLMRRSSTVLALVCQSTPASLSGKAESSYRLLHQLLSVVTEMPVKEQTWAWTTLAEIAWRLGDYKAADQHFQTGLQTGTKDYYLLRIYADYLLQQQRPIEVIELLTGETQNDSLLLRLALANQMTRSEQLTEQVVLLSERYTANRRRGSSLHKGDEARFMLYLQNRPQAAVQLAKQNWLVQREPADTYILLKSAIATNDNAIIAKTVQWLKQQNNSDVLIAQILSTQMDNRYEI